jgi:hypothetical protein
VALAAGVYYCLQMGVRGGGQLRIIRRPCFRTAHGLQNPLMGVISPCLHFTIKRLTLVVTLNLAFGIRSYTKYLIGTLLLYMRRQFVTLDPDLSKSNLAYPECQLA